MQFTFQQPIYESGSDGALRIVAEAEKMAELSGHPGSFHVDAIYGFEVAPGSPRFEYSRHSPEFLLAELYIRTNPQERERIADEWPEDELPVRRYAGNEHSTHWGRP